MKGRSCSAAALKDCGKVFLKPVAVCVAALAHACLGKEEG